MDHPTRSHNRRVVDWTLMQMAADSDPREPVRSYDRRYHQPDVTHERVRAEARLAAALAREYTARASPPADAPEQAGPMA
jgi:hypothetical protein